MYVHGEGHVDVVQNNNTNLELKTDKVELNVGDKAEFIIKNPFDHAKALITIERGEVYEYEILDIDQNLYKYSFDIKDKYIPNVYVSVVLISQNPEVKYGNLQFKVNTKKKELNIKVIPNKINYLPGEKVTLKFDVTDYNNNPVETEFSVSVVDLSVLALKGNPKKNPLVFFYNGFPLTVSTSSNIKDIIHEVDVAKATKGGGGRGDQKDLDKRKRGIFKDTAIFASTLQTDKSGKANLTFTLPDNLTTWQIETVGVSKDTKLGVNYNEIKTKKDVMVIPLKPRFVVPGDEFFVGAKIFNQTDKDKKFQVVYSSDSLKVNEKEKVISINKGDTDTVYFRTSAPVDKNKGVHDFEISIKSGDKEDVVQTSIAITRNDTYESVATAGYSNKKLMNEYIYLPENISKDKGELKINSSATLAVFLSDALNYLISFQLMKSENCLMSKSTVK